MNGGWRDARSAAPLWPTAEPALTGATVHLRPPKRRDFSAWAELRRRSRAHLERWEPRWLDDHLSSRAFNRRVRWSRREIAAGRAYPFLIFIQGEGETGVRSALVGGVTIEHVRRGAAMSASLGYWLGAPFVGRGFMTEALDLIVGFAFGALDVSRLEAACLPENAASQALLRRVGFTEERRARAYLQIDGVWRDHVMFELRRSDRLGDGERSAVMDADTPAASTVRRISTY